MNRSQLEHIIRAASEIAGDDEIVVIGSQAIHALDAQLPDIAFLSLEADVYPLHHPDRADDIDGAIGEHSTFHKTHGYYAHGIGPETAVLPTGWQDRLVRLSNPNTRQATGLCLEVHDIVLSKYAAGRVKDMNYNRALIARGLVTKKTLLRLLRDMPLDDARRASIAATIKADFAGQPKSRRRS